MDHYEFITKTDNKSLYNQIKYLVNCAQDSYQNDLNERRERLRHLLEYDEKIYEDEFIGKIKSRVDESIRERQRSLLAMKQQRTAETAKFVAEKKLRQNMENCLEIRDELRRKDYHETQLCQLEQMDEKLRAMAREKKDNEFWLNVQKRLTDDMDRRQAAENELKRALQANQCRILAKQLADNRGTKERDAKRAIDDRIALSAKLKALQQAEKEKAQAKAIERNRDVKASTMKVCEQRDLVLDEAQTYEDVFHDETMRQVRIEMEEALHKNAAVKAAVQDYLNYVHRFKAFQADLEKQRDEICDETCRRFTCYKGHHKKGIAERKRLTAESTHKVLLKQICEEQARRAKLLAAERENKILENRFARLEQKDKIKEREKIRSGLDKQLEVIAGIKAEQEKKFQQLLNRAEEDEQFCEQVLERHKSEGVDYLTPHPNWKLVACYRNDPGCRGDGK